ncbi:MAG: amidohydrolase family protein [Deltaproteobacteria bacterium]|nr:MAG: amidohydrolase family protein [Deltaproteobacteria bacterium]
MTSFKAYSANFILPITSKPLTDAVLVVDDREIIDIGTKSEIQHRYPSLEIEDCGQSVIIPGLVNAHTHLDLLFFNAGNVDGIKTSFFETLIASWLFQKSQTLTDRRQAIDEGIHQLTRSGTTTVGDTGQFFGLIPQSVNAPLRMVLFPEILTGGDSNIQEAYEAAFSQVDEIQASNSYKVTAGIAPYAGYTLSKHLLKIVSQQAAQLPVKIHAAETFSEMQFFMNRQEKLLINYFLKWDGERHCLLLIEKHPYNTSIP